MKKGGNVTEAKKLRIEKAPFASQRKKGEGRVEE